MANDRVSIKCETCGAEHGFLKYYPVGGRLGGPYLTFLHRPVKAWSALDLEALAETLAKLAETAFTFENWMIEHVGCWARSASDQMHFGGRFPFCFVTESDPDEPS